MDPRFLRKRRFPALPYFLLCLVSSAYGLMLIYSASRTLSGGNFMRNQLMALGLGIIFFFAGYFFDPDRFLRLWAVPAVLNLIFIGSLYFFGVGDSNKSWLRVGTVGIQPAEVGKLIFILTFSAHIESVKRQNFRFRGIIELALHALVTASAVIFISRDDGMSLAFIFIALFMLYSAGLNPAWFRLGGIMLAAVCPFIWKYFMDDYQRARILAVFKPDEFSDVAYQAMRSKAAISGGGLWGMGYLKGTLTGRGLIPTRHTDSVIAVAGEELGAAGCLAVLLLLAALIMLCLRAAGQCREVCPRLICSGVAGMLIFQTVLNIGMNLGLLPMVGLTLPFFSYGGSSLVTMFAAVGLVAGIEGRNTRYKINNLNIRRNQ